MAPSLRLRGKTMRIAIWTEACFGVMIFGYDQAAAGGVVGSPDFLEFPKMNEPTIEGESSGNAQDGEHCISRF